MKKIKYENIINKHGHTFYHFIFSKQWAMEVEVKRYKYTRWIKKMELIKSIKEQFLDGKPFFSMEVGKCVNIFLIGDSILNLNW